MRIIKIFLPRRYRQAYSGVMTRLELAKSLYFDGTIDYKQEDDNAFLIFTVNKDACLRVTNRLYKWIYQVEEYGMHLISDQEVNPLESINQ